MNILVKKMFKGSIIFMIFLIFMIPCFFVLMVGCQPAANITPSPVVASECNQDFSHPPRLAHITYLDFIAVGDTGRGNTNQHTVAAAMARYSLQNNVAFSLLLGDNFYPSGVESVDDPKFQTYFQQVYRQPSLDIPFYVIVGNHDHKGNVYAQTAYTAHSSRWVMPALYYTFTIAYEPQHSVQFFALDTHPIDTSKDSRQQMEWLENRLDQSDARWKIVFGHNPIYSNGQNGNSTRMIRRILPLLEKYDVDLYISGHDHDLQILKPVTPDGTHFSVSGAGCDARYASCKENTIYCSDKIGFMGLRLSHDQLVISVVHKDGAIDYCHVIQK